MKVHVYGCQCTQCHGIIQAIIAKCPDGSYFFTDVELLKIATQDVELELEEHAKGSETG